MGFIGVRGFIGSMGLTVFVGCVGLKGFTVHALFFVEPTSLWSARNQRMEQNYGNC